MQLTTLVDGLAFAEGLRWHDDALWFSDFVTRKVLTADAAGRTTEKAHVPGQPSGLGFAPDGTPLVVSMLDRKLLRMAGEGLSVVADLGRHAVGPCNDMAVDARGNAYISSMGYELYYERQTPATRSPLLRVSPAGDVSIAAPNMCGPNGIAFLSGGKQLVVAETHACRLTAFDVAPDGSLSNRRLFADLGDRPPDGICADRNGDIWVAGLYASAFLLVRDGGDILETIATPGRWAVACALGGPDGSRLFCATASQERAEDFRLGKTRSAIGYVDVDTPAP